MSTADILARLRTVLDYDQETGVFRWRCDRPGVRAGVAGGVAVHGYWRLKVDGRFWYAHRLAWFYVYGEIPDREIDHIDGNRANNAIANLRAASTRQNQQNKIARLPSSGFRGVRKQCNKWCAKIRIDGKYTHIGSYDTPEAASAAYEEAAAKHHGEFSFLKSRAASSTPTPSEDIP